MTEIMKKMAWRYRFSFYLFKEWSQSVLIFTWQIY